MSTRGERATPNQCREPPATFRVIACGRASPTPYGDDLTQVQCGPRTVIVENLPQIDDFDPIRHLAHWVLVGDRQRAGLRVGAVDSHCVRIEADREQETPAWIDVEAARSLLGGPAADR